MKDYFRQQLSELHIIGIRQTDYLSKEDVEKLLNELDFICSKQFNYIPAEIQKAEIRKQLIQDQETGKDGLTIRNIYKWLWKIADKHWRNRITEEELTPEPEPVTGERREYWLNEFKKSIDAATASYTASIGSGSRLKQQFEEIAPTPESIRKEKEMRERYLIECCGEDGSALPESPTFENFLLQQNQTKNTI